MEMDRHGFDMYFVEMLRVKSQAVTDTLKAITGGTVDFSREYTVQPRTMVLGRENLKVAFLVEAILLRACYLIVDSTGGSDQSDSTGLGLLFGLLSEGSPFVFGGRTQGVFAL